MIPIISNSETLSGCYFQKDLFYSLYGEIIGDQSGWANEENGIHNAEWHNGRNNSSLGILREMATLYLDEKT